MAYFSPLTLKFELKKKKKIGFGFVLFIERLLTLKKKKKFDDETWKKEGKDFSTVRIGTSQVVSSLLSSNPSFLIDPKSQIPQKH